jgi:hypothetical protein
MNPAKIGREVLPADPSSEAAGTSLYCFLAYLPNSTEEEMMLLQKSRKAGIFACDAFGIFHSEWTDKKNKNGKGVINAAIFLKVFDEVRAEGLYLEHDWTVKVDCDTVFIPFRLKAKLSEMRPPAYQAIYMKNSDFAFGFLGAIEVFSRRAMQIYFDNYEGCVRTIGLECGEDGFFNGCMNALGAGWMYDRGILTTRDDVGQCMPEYSSDQVAFHPFKIPDVWMHCWDLAVGKRTL